VNLPSVHRFFQSNAHRYGGLYRMRLLNKKVTTASKTAQGWAGLRWAHSLPA